MMDKFVIHIEAGLRSGDKQMPEEVNRIVIDSFADYMFCPTDDDFYNLSDYGLVNNQTHVVGNTIVDAIMMVDKKKTKQDYVYLTMHRPSNVDNPKQFKAILDQLAELDEKIIRPIHPRARKQLPYPPKNVELIEPMGYKENINMIYNAKYILTDSGGIQEEAFILSKPCVVLRDTTERPNKAVLWKNNIKTALSQLEDFVYD
jgi:UDP-N-acetylglucosamine 2-epimerase (non-hydrolysing)